MPDFKAPWHEILREEIPWYPTVDPETCIGCTLCFATCGRSVYDFDYDSHVAVVADPYNCMVGCSTCGTVCPSGAITFPNADLIHRIEREHRVIKVARKESREKKDRMEAIRARAVAEAAVARITERVHVEVAGEFGEKRFLVKLEELVIGQPYDFVDLSLRVPTVQGTAEHTPAFMSFDVVSTRQEDVSEFVDHVRRLVHDNDLVWVSEKTVG
ncbi:MAG: 4Fe-4S dicluster domain-containing protein [Acidimicrobiia bacterium]